MKTVLFIQHAGVLGGSVKSLRQLIQFLRLNEYQAKVCLLHASKEVVDYYAAYNIPTFVENKIRSIFHTSGSWVNFREPFSLISWLRGLIQWRISAFATLKVVASNPCDVVHLNSSILLPSAFALHKFGYKFIWHVRESPQPKYFGNRLQFFRFFLRKLPSERVFLSESDRFGWMGTDKYGVVIPNSFDDELLNFGDDIDNSKRHLGLSANERIILYLGGFSRIKGIFVLLDAMNVLADEGVRVICIMPGTTRAQGQSFRSRFGRAVMRVTIGGTDEMKVLRLIKERGLEQKIRMMPFQEELGAFFQAADLLVFPSTAPHFAMPVIEAAAAGKPVIASDFDGMRDLVDNGVTGLLIKPGDSLALAEGIRALIDTPIIGKKMGEAAREKIAPLYSNKVEGSRFVRLYDQVVRGVSRCE